MKRALQPLTLAVLGLNAAPHFEETRLPEAEVGVPRWLVLQTVWFSLYLVLQTVRFTLFLVFQTVRFPLCLVHETFPAGLSQRYPGRGVAAFWCVSNPTVAEQKGNTLNGLKDLFP